MGARRHRGRVLVRLSGFRGRQPADRPHDGPVWSARRDGTRRCSDGGRPVAGAADNAAMALYLTIGVLVGAGSICLGYSGQSLFLPNWFNRRRGLAIGLAFAGVGIGSMTLLPWVQHMIEQTGWRTACTAMGIVVLVVLAPINLLLHKRPEESGCSRTAMRRRRQHPQAGIEFVDPVWACDRLDAAARAIRTARFWWISLGYFSGLYTWYAVQVHQTKYLLDIGFSPGVAVWALGLVSLLGIPGQILLGHLSDRWGREWVWTVSCLGFAICFAALIALAHFPSLDAALRHGAGAGRARLRRDAGHGGGGGRNISGQALRQYFRLYHAGGARRRCGGPWITGAAARSSATIRSRS